MLLVFRFLFLLAATLCVAAAILITASLFTADRAPQSAEFLGVSAGFSGAFLGLGWLVFGIQRQVAAISAIAAQNRANGPTDLGGHLGVLVIYLGCGGAAFCLLLALIVYAIMARIDQGFAVFG